MCICAQLYSLAETPQPLPPPPPTPGNYLGSYTRALLVSQDRRHLFAIPWAIGSGIKALRELIHNNPHLKSWERFFLYSYRGGPTPYITAAHVFPCPIVVHTLKGTVVSRPSSFKKSCLGHLDTIWWHVGVGCRGGGGPLTTFLDICLIKSVCCLSVSKVL